jgi:protein-histidine pros-kinase
MGLRAKFNLILISVFLVGYIGSLVFIDQLTRQYARQEISFNAELMLKSVEAVRHYNGKEVKPLLIDRLTETFLPQSVPSYAVQRTVAELNKDYPDYSYKDAVLNPTNPRDRAADWEADIIRFFREHPDQKLVQGTRDTPTGPVLYLTHPIRLSDPNCLSCHTSAATAPASMVRMYGSDNGFGWQLNDVIGAQVVSVPMRLPLERAHVILETFAAVLAGVFVLLLLVANIILHFVVIRPVRAMADNASSISTGNMDTPELQVSGNDEIATLARSFNRMHRSLLNAMKMIERNRTAPGTDKSSR